MTDFKMKNADFQAPDEGATDDTATDATETCNCPKCGYSAPVADFMATETETTEPTPKKNNLRDSIMAKMATE